MPSPGLEMLVDGETYDYIIIWAIGCLKFSVCAEFFFFGEDGIMKGSFDFMEHNYFKRNYFKF